MTIRHGDAEWEGSLKEGTGRLSLGSGAFHDPEAEGRVAGLDEAGFEECAQAAKTQCLVSRALAGVASITLKSSLA